MHLVVVEHFHRFLHAGSPLVRAVLGLALLVLVAFALYQLVVACGPAAAPARKSRRRD